MITVSRLQHLKYLDDAICRVTAEGVVGCRHVFIGSQSLRRPAFGNQVHSCTANTLTAR